MAELSQLSVASNLFLANTPALAIRTHMLVGRDLGSGPSGQMVSLAQRLIPESAKRKAAPSPRRVLPRPSECGCLFVSPTVLQPAKPQGPQRPANLRQFRNVRGYSLNSGGMSNHRIGWLSVMPRAFATQRVDIAERSS